MLLTLVAAFKVIDLARSVCAQWRRSDGAMSVLYDLEVLPGVACLMAISQKTRDATKLVAWHGRTRPPVSHAASDQANSDQAASA